MRWNLIRAFLVLLALGVAGGACVIRTHPAHRQRTIIVHKHEHKPQKHKKHKHKHWD